MKTRIVITGVLIALLTLTLSAQDQEKRFGFELSSGPSIGLQKLGGAELNIGAGLEGIFHYRFMKHTGLYAGWGWNRFSSDESFAGGETDFEETGYVIGLQFKHPIGMSPLAYYIRGGGLYNHIELENQAGDIISDTQHGWGWQIAAGVDIPIGKTWHLTPGIKMNTLSRSLTYDQNDRDLDLQYLSVRVGILKVF